MARWLRSWVICLLVGTLMCAAAQGEATLEERLDLAAMPELGIVRVEGDGLQATYRLETDETLVRVLERVSDHLLARGWSSHPNLSEPSLAEREVQLSFVQASAGGALLELRALPSGDKTYRLSFALLTFGPPAQIAQRPSLRLT